MGSSTSRPQPVEAHEPGYRPATIQQARQLQQVQQIQQIHQQQVHHQQQQQQQVQQQQVQKKKTKTIRNDVNLKKNTFRFVQDDQDPSVWVPTFTFDCGAPCSVSIFYLATEEHSSLSLRTTLQSPGRRVLYDKQLGCKFPPEDMDKSEYRSYGIVPALYRKEQLSEPDLSKESEPTWPICIRLECVVPDEALEDHSLSTLPVGCGMQNWIQSQTTYATFKVKSDNAYGAKVHKQKIWVRGTAYELQEIYGLENANNRSTTGDDIGRECVICMSEPRDTTLLPCRHMCLCHDCAQMLRTQTNKCPICRTQVKSLLEITLKT